MAEGASGHAQRHAGKTILITGAAGDMGSATARRFSSEGCNVVLVDLKGTVQRLDALASELATEKHGALVAVCDVRQRAEVDAAFKKACERFGRVDFVFNNAGVGGDCTPADSYTEASFRHVMDVNVMGVFFVLQAAVTSMKASMQPSIQPGVIVNSASLAGLMGPPNIIGYTASKHAVIGMTRTAAKDLARHGIRVCAVAPGLMEGRMSGELIKSQMACHKAAQSGVAIADVEVGAAELDVMASQLISRTPLERLGKMDEVSSVVSFLCSADASFLTGNVVTIDGGRNC